MEEIMESELALKEAVTNECWQEAIDTYRANVSEIGAETGAAVKLLKMFGMWHASMIFAAAMMKIHIEIGHQTGKMVTESDLTGRMQDDGHT